MESGGNMLDDVEPRVFHPQIREYVDVYDVFGHFDYDPGYVCSYGTSDAATRPVRKYFEAIVGYVGAVLMGADVLAIAAPKQDMQVCVRVMTGDQVWLQVRPDITVQALCERVLSTVSISKKDRTLSHRGQIMPAHSSLADHHIDGAIDGHEELLQGLALRAQGRGFVDPLERGARQHAGGDALRL